jgi:cytoskeletal protein RodZ
MKTFGQILIEARKQKNVTLEEVETATKIRKKILQALEKGEWESLPPTTFVKGLIKNYGRYLGVDQNELLAFYRREYIERKEQKTISVPVNRNPLRLTPQLVTMVVVGLAALIFGLYLFFQYQSFTGPPLLELTDPKDNIRVTSPEVTLVGKTWDDAILKINGQEVPLSPGGTFSLSVGLNPGINTLTVTATNRFGKISTQKRTVVVDLSSTEEEKTSVSNVFLMVKANPESINLSVEVDGKLEFEGVLVAGSEKIFRGQERVRIVTKNAGSTKVVFNEVEETLGRPGEQVEKVYTKLP